MSRNIYDSDGDAISLHFERDGLTIGATQGASQGIDRQSAYVGPIDPRKLIEAIKAECEMHEDDEVHDSPAVEETARQINAGHFTVRENTAIPLGRDEYGRIRPATAEVPRLWAGADEPIIDQLIGRVADLEEEKERTEAHQRLSEHWARRLDVVVTALGMIPAPGKRGGIAAAFAGEDIPQTDRVEKALKIARFAADEDRDIPGVDR